MSTAARGIRIRRKRKRYEKEQTLCHGHPKRMSVLEDAKWTTDTMEALPQVIRLHRLIYLLKFV